MSENIYLDDPDVGAPEKEMLSAVIDSGYVSTFGPYVPEFEARFAAYLGAKRTVSTQSGTAALHIALYELGIGKGDEVIVPALTFVATVNPVIYVGAIPVFADVDADTWNISVTEIERAITKRTKAIIPVHIYGNPCAMDEIMRIASEHGLFVVEDATESLGATYKGRYTGTFGTLGCFSFNGNKTITTGGGGMLAGNDEERLDHIKFLVNQARDESRGYYHSEIGFNYRMTNIEAALGLAQMQKLSMFLEKQRTINRLYKERLGGMASVSFQEEYQNALSSFWLTCIRFHDDMDVSALQAKLKSSGIPTRRIFMPVTEFPPYRDYRRSELKNTHSIYERSLCLPSSTLNTEAGIASVCESIRDIV
jgi:perosamine synthetase